MMCGALLALLKQQQNKAIKHKPDSSKIHVNTQPVQTCSYPQAEMLAQSTQAAPFKDSVYLTVTTTGIYLSFEAHQQLLK